jgi:hypothetical protein
MIKFKLGNEKGNTKTKKYKKPKALNCSNKKNFKVVRKFAIFIALFRGGSFLFMGGRKNKEEEEVKKKPQS